jgi:hypothetical protein
MTSKAASNRQKKTFATDSAPCRQASWLVTPLRPGDPVARFACHQA